MPTHSFVLLFLPLPSLFCFFLSPQELTLFAAAPVLIPAIVAVGDSWLDKGQVGAEESILLFLFHSISFVRRTTKSTKGTKVNSA